jgi:hypothetical protein
MKQLFVQLLNILKGLNTFRFVAVYNNHIDRLNLSLISFGTPAVFVELQQADIQPLQNGMSSWDLLIRIHICDFQLDAGNGTLDQNLTVFKYRNLIRKSFVQQFIQTCGPIQADNDYQDYQHGNLYHYIQCFRCRYIDSSAFKIPNLFSGYIYWDVNSIYWDESLSVWNNAWWGAPYLQVLINPATFSATQSNTPIVYGNDLVTIYQHIFNKINTLVDSNNRKIFKNTYVFNDQVKRLIKSLISYNYPSIFVELKQLKETPLQEKVSRMDMICKLHILTEELDAGNGTLDQNLNVFSLRDLINSTFTLFQPPQCGQWLYESEKQDYVHTNVYHYEISYKFHYIDQVAYNLPIIASASIGLSFSLLPTYSI